MRKISSLIIITIGVFVILSLGTTGFITLSAASKAIETETSKHLESLAQQKSSELETKLLTIESHIDGLNRMIQATLSYEQLTSDSKNYIEKKKTTLKRSVNETLQAMPNNLSSFIIFDSNVVSGLHSIFYTAVDGTYTYMQTPFSYNDLNIQSDETAWFHLPLIKKTGRWSDPYFDFYLEKFIITYSEPVIINDQAVAVVGTSILFEDFKRFISDIKIYDTGYAFLLNENHDILVHPIFQPDSNIRTVEDGLYIPISNKIHFYEHGTQQYNFYGDAKIMGFDHLYNGWVIGIEPPMREVHATINSVRKTYLIILSIAVIIFLVIGTFVGKYLTKPIEELNATVSNFELGSLDIPVDKTLLSHQSEIGTLAQNIENMRLRQRHAFDQLLHHNEELDTIVSERTSELTATNQELEATITSLKSAQSTIVEMREQEALNDLIQHLTHKLSSPIANGITASSFLLEKSKEYHFGNLKNCATEVEKSATIIYENHSQLKNILDSLKQLMDNHSEEESRNFPIKAHVNHMIKSKLTELHKENLEVIINGKEQLMVYLPMDLLTKLMNNLLNHSIRASEAIDDRSKIVISIQKIDNNLHIDYTDVIPWQTSIGERIFNPYYQAELTRGSSGLELYVIQHIIYKGFQGTITPYETDDHYLGFIIEIPEY